MTIADRIRAAALGPTPRDPYSLTNWFGYFTEPWVAVTARATPAPKFLWFNSGNDVRRMFLLFCALDLESLENP